MSVVARYCALLMCFVMTFYVFLRYLASGNSYQSLSYSFRVGKSTVSGLVPEVCKVIWKVLQLRKFPVVTREHLVVVAEELSRRRNFPNCVGALDGKHIHLDAPPNSGSLYFNYKQRFRVNLMASCDAGYKLHRVLRVRERRECFCKIKFG
ncbi:hypothetical protein MTO96_041157 [Rhipicephalus appendiculatus]